MLFSQSLEKKYTKTPNVFFEEVLCAKGTTFNEAKLMGYLIRNTLGYNHKATWIKVSRSQLSQKAQISYGSINPTIQSCINKEWILEVKQGDKGREERYLFLCTPRNEQIVQGLEKGDLTLANLGSLIDVDMENEDMQYGLRTKMNKTTSTAATCSNHEHEAGPYSNHEQASSVNNEQGYSNDEHDTYILAEQGCLILEQHSCTVNEEDPYSTPEHVNTPSSQGYQRFEAPVKTISLKNKSTKDKNINHNNIQQHVVVVQNMIMELFKKSISRKNVESLILLAEKENVDLNDMIQNTHAYHKQVKLCKNVFGAIYYAIMNGGWEIPDTTDLCSSNGARVNPLLLQTQERPQRNYTALPIETLKSIYGLA